ncbi:protein REPRESSOR OF SILENCING 3-like [Bidens hawaiensis]|uniref:protein REPRESSOR OF SILENCING 3-like n=1 Tax=Bidens hawaiensis TaxID=980011 RepID=UPI0040499F4D
MDGDGEVTVEKTRIHVGGLGAGVTEDDLRKTFSALGDVVSVDVVRTKGRSFAYLDFLPSSDKSLPKLFSTYNGCMWKGGKLRLEKAKEHYLVKLKREWQEESERASKASDNSDADAAINHDTSEKPKKPTPADKPQINLFFPKLGKVKSLAQVGIGKHKYSFQQIQVPAVPTHFCDCEEHSADFPPPNKKPFSEIDNETYGINEQELNIMNSVMNKIFQRANPPKQVVEVSESTNGKDEEIAGETDEEDHLTDEDNLIINVANRKNDSMDLLGEVKAMMANKVQVPKKLNTSTKKPNSVNDNPQKETLPLTKKRKSSHSEETSRNSRTRLVTPEKNKNKVELVTKQSGNNSLRSLKSTWKDLLGQKRETSFNISEFIASIPQRKEEEFHSDKNKKLEADGPGPRIESEVGEATTENDIPDIVANDTPDIVVDDCEQKEEEQKADNTVDQKEEEPKTDDLDSILEKQENDQDIKEPNKDSHVKNDEDLIKTARGEFWRHKSSWTQLISTASHTSFSISHIIPNNDFGKHDQQADTFDSQSPNKNLDNQIPVVRKEAPLPPVKNIIDKKKLVPEAALPPAKNIPDKKKLLSLGKLESDETCSFMRTEESIKEWKKMKASLSGSVNKKKRLVNESA